MFSVSSHGYKGDNDIFNNFPTLESERFHLKEIKEKNFNEIYQVFLDDDVMKFSGINVVEPVRQVKNYIKESSFIYKKKQGIRWGIYDKVNNNFVGDIGLFNIDVEENSIEIGYLIAKAYWKKGIGNECSKKIIDFAFNKLHVQKIMAIIDKDNLASIKLVEKLGFQFEYEFTQLAFNRFRRHYYMFSMEDKYKQKL